MQRFILIMLVTLLTVNKSWAGIESVPLSMYKPWFDAIETQSLKTQNALTNRAIQSIKTIDEMSGITGLTDTVLTYVQKYNKDTNTPDKESYQTYQRAINDAVTGLDTSEIKTIKAFSTIQKGFEIKKEIDKVMSIAELPNTIKDIVGDIPEFKKSLTSLLDVVLISDNDIAKKAILSQNPLETFKLLKTLIADDKQSKFIDSVIKAYTNIKDIQGLDKILEGTIQMTSINMQINDEQRRFNEIKTLLSEGNVKGAVEKIIAYNLIYPTNGISLTQDELEIAEHLIDSRELRLLFHKKEIENEMKKQADMAIVSEQSIAFLDNRSVQELIKPITWEATAKSSADTLQTIGGNAAQDIQKTKMMNDNVNNSNTNQFSLVGNISFITDKGNFVKGDLTSLHTFDSDKITQFSLIPRETGTNSLKLNMYNNNQYLTTIATNETYNNNIPSSSDNDFAEIIRADIETSNNHYQYSYLAWGEWNGKANLQFTDPSNGQQSNITHGHYVVGMPTENNLPKTGTAHYTGNVQGDFTANNSLITEKNTINGTVNMDANFASSTISGNINTTHNGSNFATGTFNNIGIDNASGTFHSNLNVNNGRGEIDGTFYGKNAQELGGGFYIQNNLGNASGVYEAHKTP